jgi:antitoxin HigA-1
MSKSEGLMPPVHPGEVLREDFMKPLGLTVNRLALELHVPATRIGEIVHERRRITAETDAASGTILQHERRVLAEPPKFL